jgi:hypothetical protein
LTPRSARERESRARSAAPAESRRATRDGRPGQTDAGDFVDQIRAAMLREEIRFARLQPGRRPGLPGPLAPPGTRFRAWFVDRFLTCDAIPELVRGYW